MANRRLHFGSGLSDLTSLYAIFDGEAVKFGRAGNVSLRMAHIQVNTWKELTLLAQIRAMPQTESMIHWHLEEDWIRGEWFKLTPKAQVVIDLFNAGDATELYLHLMSAAIMNDDDFVELSGLLWEDDMARVKLIPKLREWMLENSTNMLI